MCRYRYLHCQVEVELGGSRDDDCIHRPEIGGRDPFGVESRRDALSYLGDGIRDPRKVGGGVTGHYPCMQGAH